MKDAAIITFIGLLVLFGIPAFAFAMGYQQAKSDICEDSGYTFLEGVCYENLEPIELTTITP